VEAAEAGLLEPGRSKSIESFFSYFDHDGTAGLVGGNPKVKGPVASVVIALGRRSVTSDGPGRQRRSPGEVTDRTDGQGAAAVRMIILRPIAGEHDDPSL